MIAPQPHTGGLSALNPKPWAGPGQAVSAPNRTAARPPYLPPPVPFPDQALWARVIRNARCADSSLDPDQWFPASAEADKARQEAAAAITVCVTCFVRTQCLELSLRSWDIGQHGVWGGMVAADRAALRRRKQHTSTISPVPRSEGLGRGRRPAETC
jgi:hypothetical protein